jgi:chitinase
MKPDMQIRFICLLFLFVLSLPIANAQGTVPVFHHGAFTLAGHDPSQGATMTIPTVLVPITLSFDTKETAGRPFLLDAVPDVPAVLRSPIFSSFAFASGGTTQYADAMLRSTFSSAAGWHTMLGKPEVSPLKITVPAGYGYVLSSRKDGGDVAVVDIEFLQKQIFTHLPKQDGRLVIAMTHNVTYYTWSDATICCSWGTHGVDSATGNSFVLGSYLHDAPAPVKDRDVQPLTQQLAEFMNDPLHDPLLHSRNVPNPENVFTAWQHPGGGCAGRGIGSEYFLLEPTDTNHKNNFPSSNAFVAQAGGTAYHLQNVALLPWYTGNAAGLNHAYSFPDASALSSPAVPCSPRHSRSNAVLEKPTAAAVPSGDSSNGHRLIGYWTGEGMGGAPFPLHEISPQWDTIIVAFATPDSSAAQGTFQFQVPNGLDAAQFKADIARLKKQGRKVMISLGGGGVYVNLDDPQCVPNFVSSVTRIVSEYGFDGIDIDFESPSLVLQSGDTDFRHPVTPSIMHLITALRQLHDHFGSGFMISLVPEGSQIPAGYPGYGGQFGSYLPLAYAVRDILSFIDVQDYNTPPLEGLDGEIYQSGTIDYHAAMTELLLHGFNVGGNPNAFFPPMPADKVAVGFLVGYETPSTVDPAMNYIITGKLPAGATYHLRRAEGYPGLIGAMFWTIDDDRRANFEFSNRIGPQLHSYPAAK